MLLKCLVLSLHVGWLTTSCNSNSRGSDALSQWAPMPTPMCTTPPHNLKIKKNLLKNKIDQLVTRVSLKLWTNRFLNLYLAFNFGPFDEQYSLYFTWVLCAASFEMQVLCLAPNW